MLLRPTLLQVIFLLLNFLTIVTLSAHEVRPAIIDLSIENNEHYQLSFELNIEALIAEIDQKHSDTNKDTNSSKYNKLRALSPKQLNNTFNEFLPIFLEKTHLIINDQEQKFIHVKAIIPVVGDIDLARDSKIHIRGKLPNNSKQFSWQWNPQFGSAIFRVSTPENKKFYSTYLLEGKSTGIIPLNLLNTDEKQLLSAQNEQKQGGCASLNCKWSAFTTYIEVGFVHIIPKGLDHILFVMGLFLLSTSFRPLLIQVTTFTLAHSVTLALGIYGIIEISPAVVEPLIAASIIYICVENILFNKLTRWRPLIIFLFGLLHGLGFASVLKEIGLSSQDFITGLVAFNIGVELGQLSIIMLCFLSVGIWFRHKYWYRSIITIPTSILIGCIAFYWVLERTNFL